MSKFSQQGISLYLSIIIMVILLAIVLGISGILLGQLKMMKGIENSVIAFYAADTGIERILVDRADPETSSAAECTKSDSCDLPNGANYYLDVKANGEGDCSAANFCISSVGIYKETQRAIQVAY